MVSPEQKELDHLRTKSNPFDTRVVQPGMEQDTLANTVVEWFGDDLNKMATVIERYRTTTQQRSQVMWIVGDPGSGKSTMMLAFQEKMIPFGVNNSRPTLIFRAEGSLLQRDPSDFLLSEIYNRLVSRSGKHVLKCLSSRLCGVYLRDSIRALPDNERPFVVPKTDNKETVESLRLRLDRFLDLCTQAEPEALRTEWTLALRVQPEEAYKRVDSYLRKIQAGDPGKMQRRLIGKLMRIEMEDDHQSFRDYVENAEYLSDNEILTQDPGERRQLLLNAFLTMLKSIRIPVVLLMDQLEKHQRIHQTIDEASRAVGHALATFVEIRSDICVFAFSAKPVYEAIIQHSEVWAKDRLREQPWPLDGQRGLMQLDLDAKALDEESARKIVAKRMLYHPTDGCKLSKIFPISDDALAMIARGVGSIRAFLLKCQKAYDDIVFPKPPDPVIDTVPLVLPPFSERWVALCKGTLAAKAADDKESLIYAQKGIVVWLESLIPIMKNSDPAWTAANLMHDDKIRPLPYGTLSLLWQGEKDHSLAFAWWIGSGTGKRPDLEKRLTLMDRPLLKVRALILLRRRGANDVKANEASAVLLAQHRTGGKRIKILPITDETVAQTIAFPKWLDEMKAHPDVVKDGPVRLKFLEFLREISQPVLAWVEDAQKLVKIPVGELFQEDAPALQLPALK